EGLDAIFSPRSIAVIGASRHRGKIGYEILRNLIVNEYQGILYPVNPNATGIHGIRTYPSISDVPDPVDLAVITVPSDLAVDAAKACGEKGVRGLVVITAGFREIGGVGVDPETKIVLAYIENFGNPKNFVRIARATTKEKPVIAVKSGRSEAGSRAAASHTGSLGGSDLAAEAVFSQTGVLRAGSIEELFD